MELEPHHILWGTILGYMALAITISICVHFWIRHHLKNNDLHPSRALKKRYLIRKRRKRLDSKRRRL